MPNENAIPESHIRLVATPTAGLPAEHSPYYRRLVSAGYKGFLQGNIAGASLYGMLGLVVGAIGGLAASIVAGPTAFIAIPLLGGYGLMKGASTFGLIGSNAAQLAEYAERNEFRNGLLDRLYETRSKEEANEIRKLLQADSVDQPPTKLIHFRTALIGALIGAAAVAALVYFGGGLLAATELGHGILGLLEPIIGEAGIITVKGSLTIAAGAMAKVTAIGAAFGAAAGATIGIDRGWIRRWFDVSEGAVHERDYYEQMTQERAQQVTRLHRIGQNEMRETATHIQRGAPQTPQPITNNPPPAVEQPSANEVDAAIATANELPKPMVGKVDLHEQGRVQELQKAASY